MANTNYVRDEHVFEWKFDADLNYKGNLGIIIDPNNVNLNILELIFPTNYCIFYEGIEDAGEPIVPEIEPLAHNRSLEIKSGVKFKIVDKQLNYERALFDWKEYSKWNKQKLDTSSVYDMNKNNYNATGWILNKNKKYAFLINNPSSSTLKISVSMLWNEYS